MLVSKVKKLSVQERYLYFVQEREAIRIKKEDGEPKPWTDDEILSSYRFCNIRRFDDKVSVWLNENWYKPFYDHRNMLYACALARFFNLPSTLQEITGIVFPKAGGISVERLKKVVYALHKKQTIFNHAYIVRGHPGRDKVSSVLDDYHVSLVAANTALKGGIVDRSSMRLTHANLCNVYGFGSFSAGQVVADLRWAMKGDWSDRMTWSPQGPGSTRGMLRLLGWWPKQTNMSAMTYQQMFLELSKTLTKRIPKKILDRLEAHDIQNSYCEQDKYERALWEEGRPKSNYPGKG